MTDAIFHTAKDAFGSAVGNNPSLWIVFRVTDIKTPARDPNSQDAQTIAQKVQNQLSDDLAGQYVAQLENDLGTKINTEVLAQTMGNSAPEAN
jgi:hypothetical protein